MQARYYDPVIGRFYSNDPVGWTPKNPVMSFNRYLYVNNNPYKYTDPNGEFLDAIIDVALIAYDLGDMAINGVNSVNSASLGANVAGLFIPGATGLGTTVRVRHYTNKSSANKIMDSGQIVAKDNGRVYVESASKKALTPKKAEAKHKIKEGKGNSYVETDVSGDSIEMVKNPLTGKNEMTIKGNVKLKNPEAKHRNN